jgi:hypothetical protein
MTWAAEHFTHEWAERKGEGVYCVTCSARPTEEVVTMDQLSLSLGGEA